MKTIRWLGRKVAGLVRWAAKLLRAPVRAFVRPTWKLVTMPLRLLVHMFVRTRPPETKRGFGFWWLIGTVAIAAAIGLIVAVLISPVAGIVALLTFGTWALVRRARASSRKKHDRQDLQDRQDQQDRHERATTAPAAHPSPA